MRRIYAALCSLGHTLDRAPGGSYYTLCQVTNPTPTRTLTLAVTLTLTLTLHALPGYEP